MGLPVRKLLDILFHLPQMISGKWSTETSQKNKHDRSIVEQER